MELSTNSPIPLTPSTTNRFCSERSVFLRRARMVFRMDLSMKGCSAAQSYVICALALLSACSPTRRFAEGEKFLERVEIINPDDSGHKHHGSFNEVLRQRTNTRFLGFRLPMQIHLMVSPSNLRNAQIRREEKGKSEGGFYWWIANRMGEPPVTYDPYLAERSRLNLIALAQQMGHLDATCSLDIDTVKSQRINLAYALDLGEQWIVESCDWAAEGSGLDTNRLDFDPSTLVGVPFDTRRLEILRSSLARACRNGGHPSVQASHVSFVADTLRKSLDKHVALTVELLPFDYQADGSAIPHQLTHFGKVDWSCRKRATGDVPCINPDVVEFLLAVDSGMLFNERVLQDTYKRLSSIPGVSRIEMPGTLRNSTSGGMFYDLDIGIELQKRIGLTAEVEMIRSDARYGPIVSVGFRNKNLSGMADAFEVALTGGIISTRPFSYTGDALVPNSGTWSASCTYSTLGIPPLALKRLRPSNQARTELMMNWGRELRPEYEREMVSLSYGFSFIENPEHDSKLRITPLEFRYSNISASSSFDDWLEQQANPVLDGRFADYTALATKLGWSSKWSLGAAHGRERIDAEWTGVGLRAVASRLGLQQGDGNAYLLGGIPFAHYVRVDGEWTFGKTLGGVGSLHGRIKGGFASVGINMEALPFDRAFFAGGANGVRGWSVRDLGPGFAEQSVLDADYVPGVGDVQLDIGIEFRRELTDAFGAAWFTDAGNVWMNKNSSSQGIQTQFSLRSMAWGAGMGLRFDFEFFLLRLDGAIRLYDPSQQDGKRWIGKGTPSGMFHLGIGHPF
ncbi:MAG TPA: hypothetical protein DD635_08605 [Flavobacteriales bacterium]|nr:hypothetical protein [Flavobacteriales bacterium]